jgi:general secretion pathway protein D
VGKIKCGDRLLVRQAAMLFIGASALLVTGCNTHVVLRSELDSSVYEGVANLDLSAKHNFALPSSLIGERSGRGTGETYISQESEPEGGAVASSPDGKYQVEFENAPVGAVVKGVLADSLGLTVVVDQRVSGNVTLASGGKVTKEQLLFALESALKGINVNLVKEGNVYRVIPAGETGNSASLDVGPGVAAGFGITVLPLKHISGDNILKLVDSFSAKPGAVRVGPGNTLLIQGTGDERKSVLETAMAFDKDWMRGQSVGIFPVVNALPDILIGELQRITDSGENGLARSQVQFHAIARMNAIMVVARNAGTLRLASTWIRRLDRSSNAASVTKVYRVKYGEAKQLAALMNEAFGLGGTTSASQTEPGSRLASSSSGGQSGLGASRRGQGQVASSSSASGRAGGTSGSSVIEPPSFGAGESGGSASPFGTLSMPVSSSSSSGGEGRVKITPDIASNSLLIFADREKMRMIDQVLLQLDRPRVQVAIEATIAEVSLSEGLEYGVQYALKSLQNGNERSSAGFSHAASQVLGRILPGFNALLGPAQDPRAILSALSTRTSVRVLSAPSVVALDNQVASIKVGDEVPVATTQASLVGPSSTGLLSSPVIPVTNNIDYRSTGVILRVLPRVTANGNVTLEVEQEISNVVKNTSSGTLTPTVSQRVIKSAVSVMSGQTVLLGGLISDRRTGGKTGIPFLSEIAYLGDLFARNETARDRTELLVFIQPKIIQTNLDAQTVAEEMRLKMLLSHPSKPVAARH